MQHNIAHTFDASRNMRSTAARSTRPDWLRELAKQWLKCTIFFCNKAKRVQTVLAVSVQSC